MASLALETAQRVAPEPSSRAAAELIDSRAVVADLEKLAKSHSGSEAELRSAIAQRLKAALIAGRAKAEQLLLKDRHGRRCAERICRLEDEIIRILFEFARKHLYPSQNPSEAEHMAVVATGGYGRGLQAPGSDLDLLFVLPYKQTAWGEQVAETILYCLWDTGLKSRTRHPLGERMHPPGQGGHDHPHRHSGSALLVRRPQAVRRIADPLRQRSGAQHRRPIRRRQTCPSAKTASAAPGNRAIWSSRT